ncbi:helix-turn-helix transcriptional regulator [Paenibacillus sp. Leaf72]|uniref:helix-turn-helix transcriptional regulator n=1 Tax=Paenibacillus sp. Leaf72 TaxID=1736234 RepID=UPI0006F615F6|nr:YafY family protein [Paenibacillus sp. Leaf72]KQN97759.1 transcriptional regulator [Paenibacillus sp. Leaf72]
MKIDRLLSIVMLLLERNKVSTSTLAKMFEVTPRTIFRDIEAINRAGIPIISYPGVHGGIGIMEAYKIEKKLFTVSDITALLIGLNSIQASMSSEEILTTIAKVKGLVSEEQMKDFESQISIDHTPWLGNRNVKPNFEEMKNAIHEKKLLSFKYSDHNSKRTLRKIEPYRLVLKNSNWYLQGYCMAKQDFRTFKLSRISALKPLNESFVPREIGPELFEMAEKHTITIKLLIDESLRDFMVEYCGEQNVEPHGGNNFVVSFPFNENDLGYGYLLGFGDKCECLEPEHVRLELIKRINHLVDTYKLRAFPQVDHEK